MSKKDRKKIIKFSPKKQSKSEDREIQDGLRSARLIYDDWSVKLRSAVENKKLTVEDLADWLNDLLVKLSTVKNEQARETARTMVHGALGKFAQFHVMMNATMPILIHCPHPTKETVAKQLLPEWEGFKWCDWTAAVRVFKEDFEKGVASFVCPDCGGKLSVGDMVPV